MFPLRLRSPRVSSRHASKFLFTGLCLLSLPPLAAAQSSKPNPPLARLITNYDGSRESKNARPSGATYSSAVLGTTCVKSAPPVAASFAAKDEHRVFELINRERRANGLAPLVLDEELCRLARLHAGDMVVRSFFDHTNPDGMNAAERARREGILGWRALGENIALNQGYDDPAAFAVERWLKSAKHRANITNTSWTHTGLGVARSSDGTLYFTQVFTMR